VKVTIIPEDQALDRYIVKPVIEAMFASLERRARVEVLPEPRLRGASQALNPEMVAAIVRNYPMEDLFLLLVDRDCNREGNEARAARLEQDHAGKLIAALAWQEVEVWLLALYKDQIEVTQKSSKKESRPRCLTSSPTRLARVPVRSGCDQPPSPR